jgi:hypothetical protein
MRLCDRSVWRRGRHQGGGPLEIHAEMLSEDFRKLARLSMPAVAMVTDDRDAACRSVVEGVSADNPAWEIFTLGRARLANQHVENVCVLIVNATRTAVGDDTTCRTASSFPSISRWFLVILSNHVSR